MNNKMIEHHNVVVYDERGPRMFRGRWWSVLSVDASCCSPARRKIYDES